MRIELGNPSPKLADGTTTPGPAVTVLHTNPAASFDPNVDIGDYLLHLLQRQQATGDEYTVTNRPNDEILVALLHEEGMMARSFGGSPTFLHVTPEADGETQESADAMAAVLSRIWNCPVGKPDDVEDTHFTEAGAPGVHPPTDAQIVASIAPETEAAE